MTERFSGAWRRHAALVTGLLAGALVFLPGCRKGEAAAPKGKGQGSPERAARAVKTTKVKKALVERIVPAVGTLVAFDRATISVKVPGRVAEVFVDLGNTVQKGQPIAQIEKRDYELQVSQAAAFVAQARARLGLPPDGGDDKIDAQQATAVQEARAVLNEAQKNRDRLKKLNAQGIISEAELETVEATFTVSSNRLQEALQETHNRLALLAQRRAELDMAKQNLADTTISAPFNGAIQERKTSPGEYLAAGAPVATVVQTDPLRLRIEIPERESFKIKSGQKVRVHPDGDDVTYDAQVSRVSPAITDDNRMLWVEADLKNNGRLRPGAFVRAEIVVTGADEALTVPENALVTFAGVEKVFIVQQGKAVERIVTTGSHWKKEVEIVRGVKADEVVVVDPGGLRAGDGVVMK